MTAVNKKVISINRANAYQGSSTSARAYTWNASSSYSPNSGLVPELTRIRNRARHAYRNHPYIFKAINTLVSDEIGGGIAARSPDDSLNEYWRGVTANIDPEGILQFGGLLAQVATERRVSGEVFIRKRIRRAASYDSPLQLQVLEGDYCPENLNRKLKNGNRVRAGIEFNRTGQRVAYYFTTSHPNDGVYDQDLMYGKYVRILARDVIHHYMPTRAGQLRGESDITQAIVKTMTLEKYSDAELQRKETKASYTGAITRDPLVFTDGDETVEQGSLSVQPNSMIELLPGEDITLFDGDSTGSGYSDFMSEQLRAISAALEVPYEFVTGDFRNLNDRLLRGVVDAYRRRVRMQQKLVIDQVCSTVWRWALEAGILTGRINIAGYGNDPTEANKVLWSPEVHAYIHPLQDVQAQSLAIEKGLKSRQQTIIERGGDPELVDEQRLEDQEREKDIDKPDDNNATQEDRADEKPSTTGRK